MRKAFAIKAQVLLAVLLAAGLSLSVKLLAAKSGASPEPSLSFSTPPPAPKPALANPKDLPPAFTKSVPGSVADLKAMQRHVEKLSARISPAVVAVEVGYGSGSGVLISADGLVLTAGHVCGRPNRDVKFTFPGGKTARGKTLGVNRESDTGLMKISGDGPWPFVPIGDLETAHAGDWVLALGHPGGFDAQRSLVVRLGRIIRMAPGVVQTDCTISPGDSGGPLFDMYGRVIGVHSAISTSLAENFHVPITEFSDDWEPLVEVGRWAKPRAYLGVQVVDNEPSGCLVKTVDKNSPAAKAGLKPGDRIVRVDGRRILSPASFKRWTDEASPGEILVLQIRRGDQLLLIKITARKASGSH